MWGKIYAIRDEGTLVPMEQAPFEREADLQRLIVNDPELLAGDQIRPDDPRRWLLIEREVGISDMEEGSARWATDHLYLDQDGIPTIVETKRAADSRIRREVVGQVLDYAANAVAHWPAGFIRNTFEQRCHNGGREPDEVLAEAFGPDVEPEEYWEWVRTNLQAERIRILFVADGIPHELQRIVEFLNGQMDPAEVLAVEVSTYEGEGLRVVVPRLIGLSAEAERRKGSRRPRRDWDDDSFDRESAKQTGQEAAEIAGRIRSWANRRRHRIDWGTGRVIGSFMPRVVVGTKRHSTFSAATNGEIQVHFAEMRAPFDTEDKRRELLDCLNRIPDVDMHPGSVNGRPILRSEALVDEEALAQFFDCWEWYEQKIRGHDEQS